MDMVTIPMGTTVVKNEELQFIRDDRMQAQNTLSILKARVLREWVENSKKGYSATLYCKEIADIIGLTLPVIEREVADDSSNI